MFPAQKNPGQEFESPGGLEGIATPKLDPGTILRGLPGADKLILALPLLERWIDQTIAQHAADAKPLSQLGFKNLEKYFPEEFLNRAKVVVVDVVPVPPLEKLGLGTIGATMPEAPAGITYKDTFFVYRQGAMNESLHFHESIHIAQYDRLGVSGFMALYALGLAQFGYRNSPLEETAYSLEERFKKGGKPFDAIELVDQDLRKLLISL